MKSISNQSQVFQSRGYARGRPSVGTVGATILLSLLFVLGISVPANAASTTYANQSTARNQTITSATHAMNGGSVSSSAGSDLIQTRATVVGVSSFGGLSSTTMNYSHSRVTTQVYCQWRADNPAPYVPPVGTKYNLTCKYTY